MRDPGAKQGSLLLNKTFVMMMITFVSVAINYATFSATVCSKRWRNPIRNPHMLKNSSLNWVAQTVVARLLLLLCGFYMSCLLLNHDSLAAIAYCLIIILAYYHDYHGSAYIIIYGIMIHSCCRDRFFINFHVYICIYIYIYIWNEGPVLDTDPQTHPPLPLRKSRW